ncbi:sensor histidine kinase [Empedobacter sp. ULE_I136]
MKKGFYKILIVIMSVALIGLIIIQFYWLNLTIQNGTDSFNNNVYQAMNYTTEKINKNELERYYKKFNNIQSDLKSNKDKPQVVTNQVIKDSLGVTYAYVTRYVVEKSMLPSSGKYNDSLTKANIYSQERVFKIDKDSSARGIPNLNLNFEHALQDGTFTLESAARWDAGSTPIDKRVNYAMLDSILKNELRNRGIHQAMPILAVLKKDSTETNVKSKDFDCNKIEFMVPLFLDRKDHIEYYLAANFVNRNLAIVAPTVPVISLTFILTMIIITVFSLSIYYMQLQRKSSEIKTDFINNMTHEFKTPIATINIASDALRNEKIFTDPEKVKYYADLIKQENKRMNAHVEMVLRMSKLDRNQMDMNFQEVNLNGIVQKSVEPIRFIVEERNGTIFEEYNAEQSFVKGDPFHLENIVINVLDNARKYSPNTPEIRVKTYNKDNNFLIEISDKGMGMPQSVLKKIFEQFYREETGNIHNVKGHGLGLAYVKKIVQLHGGQVWAESSAGKGSTFFIKIPLKS